MARRRDGGLLLGLAVGTLLLGPAPGSAEVATDGTLGAKVRLTGRDVKVPARLGQTRGQNLFHSFERFGVEAGNKVTFTAPERLKLKNVIGRVTGGEASRIDGTLASSIPGADLWLLNPAGILFGPGARLDVPGSFHASTADELRFEDGAVFSALDRSSRVLSVAPPEAFGFLRARPAGITLDHSTLGVPPSKALSLVGGDLTVTGGTLRAEAGTVALAAATAGEIDIEGSAAFPAGANIRLTEGAAVNVSGDGGGTVRIRGGRLLVENGSSVSADNRGAMDAEGGIMINAGAVRVEAASKVTAYAHADGDAGLVRIAADRIELVDGGMVSSDTYGTGKGGTIELTGNSFLAQGGLEQGGRALRSVVSASAAAGSSGDAGSLAIAADRIELVDGGQIGSGAFGTGKSGTVGVTGKTLLVQGKFQRFSSGVFARAERGGSGDAGSVRVAVDRIELLDGGVIAGDTFTAGKGGTVEVTGKTLLAASPGSGITSTGYGSSDAGTVRVAIDQVTLRDGARIGSGTVLGSGNAGTVRVEADQVTLSGGALIDSRTVYSTGDAGTVIVEADQVTLRDRALIDGRTYDSMGNAGTVKVEADRVELHDGGQIGSGTFLGPGNGGTVEVTARVLLVEGGQQEGSRFFSSGVYASAEPGSGGDAGDVDIRASRLVVRNSGRIGSSSDGTGMAGNVRLRADTLLVEDAGIRTRGTGAKGGQIEVAASDLIHLEDAEVTSSGIEPGPGISVITLRAPLIAVNNSRVTSLTGSGDPLAGSGVARLFGGQTVISSDSIVAASSTVTITGLEKEVGSQLLVPQGVFLDAGDLLRESCAARRAGTASSFTATGRGGLPPDPSGPLAGSYGGTNGAAAAGEPGSFVASGPSEGCGAASGG
jgi:filamentous hemagglutinin family protein